MHHAPEIPTQRGLQFFPSLLVIPTTQYQDLYKLMLNSLLPHIHWNWIDFRQILFSDEIWCVMCLRPR